MTTIPRIFAGIADAADAARTFILTNVDGLPEHLRPILCGLTGTGSSPVDLIARFAEAAFANSDEISVEGKEIAAGAALFAEGFGFHGMNENSRGTKIAKLLTGQSVSEPPEPRADLLPPALAEPQGNA